MSVSPLLRPLGIFSSILGTIQGLTLVILSIIAILIYGEGWILYDLDERNIFNYIAFQHFFRYDDQLGARFAGTTLFIFAIAYCLFSFIWAVNSMIIFWSFFKEKYIYARLSCYFWGVTVIIITCLDVTSIILIGLDMKDIKNHYKDALTNYMYHTVVGIVMTIIARGYVLLIINVILVIYLTKLVKTLPEPPKPAQSNRPLNRTLYYLYSTYHYSNVTVANENPHPPQPENSNLYNNPTLQSDKPEMRQISNDTQHSEDNKDVMSSLTFSDIGPYIPPPDYNDDDTPRWGELKRMRKAVIPPQSYN